MTILKHLLAKYPYQTVAIFPRHMHRINAWKKKLNQGGLSFHLRSQLTAPVTTPGIILWDTFGELRSAYGIATTVFVGGSLLPLGGQNFIEPALQGALTVTGPYYDDFSWVTDEIFNKGIVIKENHWKTVARTIVKALEKPGKRSDRSRLALKYLHSNQGGTQKACHEILKAFDV